MKRKLFILSAVLVIACTGIYFFLLPKNAITSITLTSPHNNAIQEAVTVKLRKPASVYVEYWEKGTSGKYRTVPSAIDTTHLINLLLLKADHTYEYRVVIDGPVTRSSDILSFTTREQSPWLVNKWLHEEKPHDASALGDGFIMLCFARKPGYIAMIDGEGEVRWYWQTEDLGVRTANLTPRGTLIAMLRPAVQLTKNDVPQTHEAIAGEEIKKPMRRGELGFAGGTAIAEVDLTGEMMWRVDLNRLETEKEYQIIHHEIRMDEKNRIHTLTRPRKIIDLSEINAGCGPDTLSGDGILVLDSLGTPLRHWSCWDVWDIKKDPYIERYMYDRFHMNGFCFDTDGNYLVSVPIEDQIWKVDSNTGKLIWKFGRNGDFPLDTALCFSFQHSPYLNEKGDLMLFDNGLYNKQSRALSFRLDEEQKTAIPVINTPVPKDKYTSRMGSAYLLPNGNILQTSSKTGIVMVTDPKGTVLWEINLAYAPYRAVYVPMDTFKNYFTRVE